MKSNQQKNRNHQPSQYGYAPFNTTDLFKNMQLIGADIKISDGRDVTIPRAEYNDMLRRLAYLDMVLDFLRKEKASDSDYLDVGDLRKILGVMNPITTNEKEDK